MTAIERAVRNRFAIPLIGDIEAREPSEGEVKMTSSKQIAGLIGPTIVVLATSEALNFQIWENNIPPVTYLNGTLLFVAGLAIVRAHNRWTRGWPVMVTLAGWIVILGGLYRMFAPAAPQAPRSTSTYAFLMVLFAIGILLTFKAHSRTDTVRAPEVRSKTGARVHL